MRFLLLISLVFLTHSFAKRFVFFPSKKADPCHIKITHKGEKALHYYYKVKSSVECLKKSQAHEDVAKDFSSQVNVYWKGQKL